MASLQWEKLSPQEFQQLQDLAEYANKKLQDVLVDFCGSGPPYKHNPDGVSFLLYQQASLNQPKMHKQWTYGQWRA
ncbi:hypothetical protein GWI33_004233 [Rhynchophorus ferrugineus]|uniref:Diacylglycerol kinase type I N-terminal domain-containing protein n=1 Tax=Rhynchophorus ferrugineus TaxID=354439 RepID=A0A834MKL6_RHYFE|nr:hypothetical protein GWI33_004233 [Rhynchophorus ferrugineus]